MSRAQRETNEGRLAHKTAMGERACCEDFAGYDQAYFNQKDLIVDGMNRSRIMNRRGKKYRAMQQMLP